MSSHQPKQHQHFFWIDALRGYASLAIVLFHVNAILWVGNQYIKAHADHYSAFDQKCALFSLPFQYGYSAVILFFLISGFCIHWPYANHKRLVVREYAKRRFFRIFPPYLLAVALSALGLTFVHPALIAPPRTIGLSFIMLQNYDFSHLHYPNFWEMQIPTNSALWSLPIEAEFYITYPIVLYFARKYGFKVIIAGITLISVLATALGKFMPLPDFFHYWIIWILGAYIAESAAKQTLPKWNILFSAMLAVTLIVSLLAGLIARHTLHVFSPIEDFPWAMYYGLLILRVLTLPDIRIMRNRFFTSASIFLGKISYSLYLTHYLTLYTILTVCNLTMGHSPDNYLTAFLLGLICVPVSYIFWKFVELPSMNLTRRRSN
jgi:peptidoglycan/LPS O-acetylase OafA/YrhL